ncbi:MAG: acyl-CoA thioesterase [Bacteroidales bacterium]|nr:acyl-CoA thioesterase [Bacteroidales bacterium]
MIHYETTFPVRYYEADPMGIVHHSNYLRYFECARDEMIASWGYGIEKCQEDGIVFPVVSTQLRFHASAKIGDTLRVVAEIESLPLAKLTVKQAVYNQDGVLCADGTVVLGFLNTKTGRIMGCPEQFRKLMEKYDK